jgi:ABC-type branched-subunit amino acid transport system substrate-binding protein
MSPILARCLTAAALGVALALPGAPRAADPGVAADRILLGQAAPFEGPAAALGIGMRQGLLAAFAEVNAKGGVKGRRLELVARDDGYEPTKSIEAVKALIAEGVFALVGPVGTPTSMATHPLAAQAGVPFIGPFTGAEGLRNPYKAHIVNVRASYFQETEEMVERLTKDLKIERIAILFQDDAFGRAGLAGARRAMDKRGMKLVAEAAFERNTIAVKRALLEIRRADPQAVIMVGPYKPMAEFIKRARQIRFDATFVNISFVGSEALAKEVGPAGDGVVITQVVPFPWDKANPLVARYQAALKAVDPQSQPGFVSLEGYLVGRLVIAALEQIDGEPTRKAMMERLTKGSFDIDGAKLAFGPDDNQGMDQVFVTVLNKDGSFKSVTRLEAPGS